MANAVFSAEYLLPITRLEIGPAAKLQVRRMPQLPWQAIADAASGITFLGVLGWEVWRIGGQLAQLAAQAAAAGGGYLL